MKRIREFRRLAAGIVMVALLVYLPACSSDKTDEVSLNAGATTILLAQPVPEVDDIRHSAVEVARLVSRDVEDFSLIDVALLRADEDLAVLYDDIASFLIDGLIPLELASDDIDLFGFADQAMILGGISVHSQVRALLEETGVKIGDTSGVEIWETNGTEWFEAAAFVDDFVVLSSTEDISDCVEISTGHAPSLLDNGVFEETVSRLSGELFMMTWEYGGFCSNWYDQIVASASCSIKGTDGSIAMASVLQFECDHAGRAAHDEVYADLLGVDGDHWRNIMLRQDDAFLMVTADQDMADFIGDDNASDVMDIEL